ncbi:MAG: STAS/SEC14 domain-containing protein [Candidatus Aminicenantes bacterium]|nr:STAS/SEC14 domain-containing protein [Candidatus Aminicenantes bacterium]
MKVFEEKDQYELCIETEKNRIILDFGECQDPAKLPNYNKHVREALKKVTPGYSLMASITEKTKPPKLAITKMLKESQQDFINGGVNKTAVVVPSKAILQKMTLLVVTKLSGMNIKVFSERNKAEKWLDEKD